MQSGGNPFPNLLPHRKRVGPRNRAGTVAQRIPEAVASAAKAVCAPTVRSSGDRGRSEMHDAGTQGGFWFWGSLGLVVAGNVAYHLGLKQVPRDVHPLAPLVVLFLTA